MAKKAILSDKQLKLLQAIAPQGNTQIGQSIVSSVLQQVLQPEADPEADFRKMATAQLLEMGDFEGARDIAVGDVPTGDLFRQSEQEVPEQFAPLFENSPTADKEHEIVKFLLEKGRGEQGRTFALLDRKRRAGIAEQVDFPNFLESAEIARQEGNPLEQLVQLIPILGAGYIFGKGQQKQTQRETELADLLDRLMINR